MIEQIIMTILLKILTGMYTPADVATREQDDDRDYEFISLRGEREKDR